MLVFIHGLCNIPDAWAPMMSFFSDAGYSCAAPDLRKGLDLRRTRVTDYVEKMKGIVTTEDVVIGHSLGGLIVQKIAEETDIRAAVAICSAPPRGIAMHIPLLHMLPALRYFPYVLIRKPFKPGYSLARNLFLAGMTAEEEQHALKEYEKLGKDSALVIRELLMHRPAVDERKIDCPLLFIGAKRDTICSPETVKQMAEKYHAEYQEYDCCHHFFVNNNWKEVAQGIQEFLSQHGLGPTGKNSTK
jgi:pimeloyl-ACP methyl ester carboxylesterase